MFSHKQIWAAIDTVAQAGGMSAAALAKRAGLDPTAFNPSKRVSSDGRERWPSTETLAKALKAANLDLKALADIIDSISDEEEGCAPKDRSRRRRWVDVV
ncbi:hypothetical protein [Microvirga sp. P5_D2]|jgi:phage repressor protein C with HTH and peptisase S24 domain